MYHRNPMLLHHRNPMLPRPFRWFWRCKTVETVQQRPLVAGKRQSASICRPSFQVWTLIIKIILSQSYLCNRNSYSGNTSLYWDKPPYWDVKNCFHARRFVQIYMVWVGHDQVFMGLRSLVSLISFDLLRRGSNKILPIFCLPFKQW